MGPAAMPRRPNPVPTYRLPKQSGQAIVTLRDAAGERRDVLLGKYDSPESKAEYERVLAEWRIGQVPRTAPAGLSVAEVLVRYWKHAEAYYRHPDGTPTHEVVNI